MTHEQRLGINKYRLTDEPQVYYCLVYKKTCVLLMIAPLTKYSWLLVPVSGGISISGMTCQPSPPGHLLVTVSAKTLHLPSEVGPSNQGLVLFYRPEESYFAVLMYWHSHKNGEDAGKFKSGYNCVVLLGEDVLLADAVKSPHLGSKLANSSIGLAI